MFQTCMILGQNLLVRFYFKLDQIDIYTSTDKKMDMVALKKRKTISNLVTRLQLKLSLILWILSLIDFSPTADFVLILASASVDLLNGLFFIIIGKKLD